MHQNKPVFFRVRYLDAAGTWHFARKIPSHYALSWEKCNRGTIQPGTRELTLNRGWMLRIDRQSKTFECVSRQQEQVFLSPLFRLGMIAEAYRLGYRTAAQTLHLLSRTPFHDPADYWDRHWLPAGSFV